MLIVARILTGLLALIALGTGTKSLIGGLTELGEVDQILDNTFRYYAGVWAGVGLGLAYCAAMAPEGPELLRFLMVAVFIGGIGRAVGMTGYEAIETKVMVGTAIEMIVPIIVIAFTTMSASAS